MITPQHLQWNPASTPIPKPTPNTVLIEAVVRPNKNTYYTTYEPVNHDNKLYWAYLDGDCVFYLKEGDMLEHNWVFVSSPTLPQP